MLTDEFRYKILKALQVEPDLSQRELARRLGISVGKVNFCIQALITKGLVKASNFKKSSNKIGYLYLLTPKGLEDKGVLTKVFLKRKLKEYEELEKEIDYLRREVVKGEECDLT